MIDLREVRITAASAADLDDIVRIDVATLKSPSPVAVYERELDNELARIDVARLRSESGQEVVAAFVDYWLVADEVHLLSIATLSEYRRRGLGRSLMDRLVSVAREFDSRCVTLEVRASNEAAQNLYLGLGFETVSVRKRYYADSGEDALVMILNLRPPAL